MQRKNVLSKKSDNNQQDSIFGGIYTEYFNYTREYGEKYGDKTIVLMQVGAFYEMYGIKNTSTNEITGSLIYDVCEICQLNISEKKVTYGSNDKLIVMAGFRDFAIEKYIQKLTEYGYIIPVFIQEKDGKNVTRKLYEVYSIGTYISCDTDSSPNMSNNFMCVWIDLYKPFTIKIGSNRNTIVIGVSVINIFTGKSFIFQYETSYILETTTFDELERYFSVYSPCEVIFITPFDSSTVNKIMEYSGVVTSSIHRVSNCSENKNEKVVNCKNQKYIKQILSNFFGEESYDICAEFHNRIIATQSFCYLLNYIKEQNSDLVRKISIPDFNNTSDRLILANHTLSQLNIIDDSVTESKKHGKVSSVLHFLNKCCSPIGRRLFQYQLTNPTFNEEWLNIEYEMTGKILESTMVGNIDIFRRYLTKIRDIEKLCRQILLKKIYPSSIYHLFCSIEYIREINMLLREHSDICNYLSFDFDRKEKTSFDYINDMSNSINDFLYEHFEIDACKVTSSMTTFDNPIIKKCISVSLDRALESQKENLDILDKIRTFFNEIIQKYEKSENPTDYVKIHETEKSGSSLQITSRRSQILKTVLEKDCSDKIELSPNVYFMRKDVKFTKSSASNVDIEFPLLNEICKKLLSSKEVIQSIMISVYMELLTKLENLYFDDLEKLAKFVGRIDVLQCKAYIAKNYNYCSPIIEKNASKSFVDAYDMRHCLIEHIQQNELYVTNDVCLGQNNTNGFLLYGTNAVGKTSLIRALGICIIMAQSGLYVPCSRFIYKPYTAIFSRILGNDNLFKGLSTFAVEISELRIIMKMSDENSLILGDELCSGTEMESALSIFAAGLNRLHTKGASFIFATHFHEIVEFTEIKELKNMKLKHMRIEYDREKDCIIYDRKLRDGSGPRIYGLEVCKSLYLDADFLSEAHAIRNKYFPESRGELSFTKAKAYNSNKLRGMCEICGEKMGQEIHHLHHQKDANEDGFIGSFHKNHPANLLSICEKCHDELHIDDVDGNLNRKKTTNGYKVL